LTGNTRSIPDAPRGNWVDRFAPAAVRPYARLARWDRPIGWWLLLLPCWWSAALAADSVGRSYPDIPSMVLFLIGAIAMRGAGCTYNDIVDRDLDASVARTRNRPIPAGAVSVNSARLFLIAQALVGVAVLLQFNGLTIWLGLVSLAVVALYPFLKRLTNWPQIGLGLAFSWGALLGWTAETGAMAAAPIILYAGCIFWVMGYDTIYALQDKEDDALIGIGSTARLFGDRVRAAVAAMYAGALILFAGAFAAAGVGWIAWLGLAAGALQLGWQASLVRPDGERALELFRSNRRFGLIVVVALLADAAITAGS
jgi:4-hydroxybenzoate polyprenyltransferase